MCIRDRACAALGARVVVNDVDAAPATVVAQEIREAGGEALSLIHISEPTRPY